jgi:hypothetical protein
VRARWRGRAPGGICAPARRGANVGLVIQEVLDARSLSPPAPAIPRRGPAAARLPDPGGAGGPLLPGDAPQLTLTSQPLNSGRLVELSGTVTDSDPTGVTVTFSGVVSASTTPDAAGYYVCAAQASALGDVSAVATDGEGLSSEAAQAVVTSPAPTLTLAVAYGTQRTITLSGRVTDDQPGACTVTFTGVATGSTPWPPASCRALRTPRRGSGRHRGPDSYAWSVRPCGAGPASRRSTPGVLAEVSRATAAGADRPDAETERLVFPVARRLWRTIRGRLPPPAPAVGRTVCGP